MANMPFVGAGVLGSAVSMDKDVTKRLLRDAGLAVAPFVTLTRANRAGFTFEQLSERLGLPLFVKPANQAPRSGSAGGKPRRVRRGGIAGLQLRSQGAGGVSDRWREIECAVLGNDDPQASVCGEIVLSDAFYSYDTKYINEQGAQVVVPAAIAPEVSDHIREVALKAFRALECFGLARVDVFLTPDNGGDQRN